MVSLVITHQKYTVNDNTIALSVYFSLYNNTIDGTVIRALFWVSKLLYKYRSVFRYMDNLSEAFFHKNYYFRKKFVLYLSFQVLFYNWENLFSSCSYEPWWHYCSSYSLNLLLPILHTSCFFNEWYWSFLNALVRHNHGWATYGGLWNRHYISMIFSSIHNISYRPVKVPIW